MRAVLQIAAAAYAHLPRAHRRVHATTTATIEAPYVDRPLEGFLVFNVELLPMSSPSAEAPAGGARAPPAAVHVARILERQVRDARAIDSEALCIVPGEAVWSLRVDVRVLDDGGNVTDAAALAALGSLLHFRRPDVTVRGRSVHVHPYDERVALPLAVHHLPVTVTAACFSPAAFAHLAAAIAVGAVQQPERRGDGEGLPPLSATAGVPAAAVVVFDPTLVEQAAADGVLTFCLNAHGELCGVHKLGGCPLTPEALAEAAVAATPVAVALVGALKAALASAEAAASEKAMREHVASGAWRAEQAAAAAVVVS